MEDGDVRAGVVPWDVLLPTAVHDTHYIITTRTLLSSP